MTSHSGRVIRQMLAMALTVALGFQSALAGPVEPGGRTAKDAGARRASGQPCPKLSPDLEETLQSAEKEEAKAARTLGEIRRERLARAARPEAETDSDSTPAEDARQVIVQLDDLAAQTALKAQVARLNGRITRTHEAAGLVTIELPLSRVRELAAERAVAYVSPDRPVKSLGHVTITTGAAQVRNLAGDGLLDGSGIGVAVLDSGIDQNHSLLKHADNHPGVVERRNFTDGNGFDDPYGHGTHVATMLAGGHLSAGTYEGIAPGANLLNLTVLDASGQGRASDVIAAIEWCIQNKAKYNIRVINMSLGAPARDSYRLDPLCRAARRAFNAGIVVVAAAGNDGKDANGQKVYGGIHSPGIEPSVITVGAANTFGTNKRSDDVVTTYSSRGPTRGYYTDADGVKHYDDLIKPDLVAPGNKLIGASSNGGGAGSNYLAANYPVLDTGISARPKERVMYLSGTSVATPMVSGAAALLLEANPNLTPGLVKATLMYSAQLLKGFNTLEQGAGLLNIDGAVRLAKLIKADASSLACGEPMLTSQLPDQSSMIEAEPFLWSQGVITNYGVLYGSDLMTYWQGMYAEGILFIEATPVVNSAFTTVPSLVSSGVKFKSGPVTISNEGILFAEGILYTEGIIFIDGAILSDGILFSEKRVKGEGILFGDGILIVEGAVITDGIIFADNGGFGGDNTPAMQPAP
ncbi:MAG TPA: S8 family peptidase [Blastocatellia bacterium]|nr:S8 family peptidase [Blastocatellia bacterium]